MNIFTKHIASPKNIFSTSVGLLCFILLSITGCKVGFFGKIEGRLIEPEGGMPMRNITVELEGTKMAAATDNNGGFMFIGVAAGTYTIHAKTASSLYEDAYAKVTVKQEIVNRVEMIVEIKPDAIYESVKDTVKLNVLKKGYTLVRGGYGYGSSQSSPTNYLVMLWSGHKRVILKPNYFKGYVEILTPEEALDYVRFFTDPSTFYLFKDLNRDNHYIEVMPTKKKPSVCEMPDEEFKRLGMFEPVVTNDENHFYVTRFIVSMQRNLYKIKESVTFDGGYEAERMLILAHMDIPLPVVK